MNICIFSAQYPPHIGGIERFTESLAAALVKRGNYVVVVTNNTDGEPGVEIQEGLSVYRLPCVPLFSGRLPLPKLARTRRRMISELQSMRFDGVLINARFYPHTLLGMKLARRHGLTPVVLDHGSDYLTFGKPCIDVLVRAYEHLITWYGKRYHPRYFGVSQRSAQWLERFHIAAEGIISNSINAEEFRDCASARSFRKEYGIREDRALISFVGRLIPEKGINALIKVAKKAFEHSLAVDFIIAGDGPLLDAVRACPDNVHAVGRLAKPDIAALLAQSNALILPSRSEGFATCLLEAAACSTPAITTDVGGAHELIPDSRYGIILNDGSEASIFDAVLWCVEHPGELEDMGANSYQMVSTEYSWDAGAKKVEEIFAS